MEYAVAFVGGMVAATVALAIWYSQHVSALGKERLKVSQWHDRLRAESTTLSQRATDLQSKEAQLNQAISSFEALKVQYASDLQDREAAFDARNVQYDSLLRENSLLKQDLFNHSVRSKKTERDHAAITRTQEEIDKRAHDLADRYLKENVSWIGDKLNANNFGTSKARLLKVIQTCRSIGFDVSEGDEQQFVQDLKVAYEKAVRAQFLREEQARIKAQIREEEQLAKEIDKQIKESQREQAAIEVALEKALQKAKDEYSAEVEHLRAKLKEAQENAERAKSRAQMTKSGHVYVISNVGSFGSDVYKIGMTRRLAPEDRVKELSSASVPFPFDVHMMISCDDAPSLENTIHRELHKRRLNKVNPRKEFFRVDLDSLVKVVETNHGQVDYIAEPEALQYRDGLSMSEEDQEFVEQTTQLLMGEEDGNGLPPLL